MNCPQTMDFQALKHAIYAMANARSLNILSEDEDSITVLDYSSEGENPREITFTNPKTVDYKWLRSHVWIHPRITEILKDDIVSGLMEMDFNTFITLRHLVILPTYDDLKDYIHDTDVHNNTVPQKCRTNSQPIGQLWQQANCAIIYYDNIKRGLHTARKSVSDWETFHMCVWETIFHELRHLMMDCNPFLSKRDYPVSLASEDAVEDFCRNEYKRIFLAY